MRRHEMITGVGGVSEPPRFRGACSSDRWCADEVPCEGEECAEGRRRALSCPSSLAAREIIRQRLIDKVSFS